MKQQQEKKRKEPKNRFRKWKLLRWDSCRSGVSPFFSSTFFFRSFSFFFSYIFLDNLITCRTQGEIHTTHRRSHAAFSFPFFPLILLLENIKRALLRDTQSAAHIQGYITIYMMFSSRGFDVIALVRIRPGDARICSASFRNEEEEGCCVAFRLGGRFKLYIWFHMQL